MLLCPLGFIVIVRVLFGHELRFEFLHRAASFSHEPTELARRPGELVWAENYEEQKPDCHHLL
jgi:hypothetical protein